MSARAVKPAPKTQKAWRCDKDRDGVARLYETEEGCTCCVSVLVVPVASITGCKHNGPHDAEAALNICIDCGSWWSPAKRRWQRPRILKVSR